MKLSLVDEACETSRNKWYAHTEFTIGANISIVRGGLRPDLR